MHDLIIPAQPLILLFKLQSAGYEAALVGGAVRDMLRNKLNNESLEITDFDIATNATPEQIQAVFPTSYYENTFGTVSITHEEASLLHDIEKMPEIPPTAGTKLIDIAQATKLHASLNQSLLEYKKPIKQSPPYEITTYRSDGVYTDYRRPEKVTWGSSLQEDVQRRDFTINAMAIIISQSWLDGVIRQELLPNSIKVPGSEISLIDFHNGQSDLENNIIHTVGDPHERFQEDALRMLRAIRFSVQLNASISAETFDAITTHSKLLAHVSQERIRDELFKMLGSKFPKEAIELMDKTQTLQFVLPELIEAKGVEQARHHTTDVWTHSLDALSESTNPDPIVRLATLLHDIGKPRTVKIIDGIPTFYNHDVVGAHLAKDIGKRLRLSHKEIDRLFILVRFHMFHYQPENSDSSIRRFMRNVGLTNIDDILDVREADRLGSGARRTSWRLEEMKERMVEQLHQPMDVTDLAINGHDLINEFNLTPGKIIGDVLQTLFEDVLETPEHNTKEYLLEQAKIIISSNK